MFRLHNVHRFGNFLLVSVACYSFAGEIRLLKFIDVEALIGVFLVFQNFIILVTCLRGANVRKLCF